jgi:hypothetical protein
MKLFSIVKFIIGPMGSGLLKKEVTNRNKMYINAKLEKIIS